MILAKSLSKRRLSIVFTFATSLATLSLLKLTVLQRKSWEGGESLKQQHSEDNLLEKVCWAVAITELQFTITIFAATVRIIARRSLLLCHRCSGLTIGLKDSGWDENLSWVDFRLFPRFAQWNHSGETEPKQFQHSWVALLKVILAFSRFLKTLKSVSQELLLESCNIVDIGAHGGDTTLPLALVAR